MPTYYFLEINFFDCANIVEATIIKTILSIRGKKLPCELGKKDYLKKLKYDSFKLCKNSFFKIFFF